MDGLTTVLANTLIQAASNQLQADQNAIVRQNIQTATSNFFAKKDDQPSLAEQWLAFVGKDKVNYQPPVITSRLRAPGASETTDYYAWLEQQQAQQAQKTRQLNSVG
jgi:hypothetical protein